MTASATFMALMVRWVKIGQTVTLTAEFCGCEQFPFGNHLMFGEHVFKGPQMALDRGIYVKRLPKRGEIGVVTAIHHWKWGADRTNYVVCWRGGFSILGKESLK